jgi:hypothetical protein
MTLALNVKDILHTYIPTARQRNSESHKDMYITLYLSIGLLYFYILHYAYAYVANSVVKAVLTYIIYYNISC